MGYRDWLTLFYAIALEEVCQSTPVSHNLLQRKDNTDILTLKVAKQRQMWSNGHLTYTKLTAHPPSKGKRDNHREGTTLGVIYLA